MNNSQSLAKQRQILAMRDKLVNSASQPGEKLRAEESAFEMLREASPALLRLALIQRYSHDYVAAFLIGKIGSNAWRFLVTGEKWQIMRTRQTSDITPVGADLHSVFMDAVLVQGAAMAALSRLKKALEKVKHAGT